MPIVKKILNNFLKQYGPVKGRKRYFQWETANPEIYKKGLDTAIKHKDRIIRHPAPLKSGTTTRSPAPRKKAGRK